MLKIQDCAFFRGASDGAVPVSISPVPEGFMKKHGFRKIVKKKRKLVFSLCRDSIRPIRSISLIPAPSTWHPAPCTLSPQPRTPGFYDFLIFTVFDFFVKCIWAINPSGIRDMETGTAPSDAPRKKTQSCICNIDVGWM